MGAESCNFISPDEIMVTGLGEIAKLLKRSERFIPGK